MKEMTRDEAIAYAESGEWKNLTDQELVALQLHQRCLCIPLNEFQRAMEVVLGRPVWTHEFADPHRLKEEYLGIVPTATLEDVLNVFPSDNRIIVVSPGEQGEGP